MIETIPEITNGPMGWGLDDHTTIDQRHNIEKRHFDRISADCPICFRSRPIRDFMPTMMKAFNAFQESKGLFPGSCDMTLLDEFLFGKRFRWRSQDIGSCFPAGTFISMESGDVKAIEDVRVGDRVVTGEGHCFPVTRTMSRHADELMFTIKSAGELPLRLTAEHPLLTKRGYVKASELSQDDMIWQPRYAPTETVAVVQTYAHIVIGQKAVAETGRGGHRLYVDKSGIPDLLNLNEDFGRFIGLFLAEGCVENGDRVSFTFGKDHFESATFVKEWMEKLGFAPRLCDHTDRGVWRVRVSSRRFTYLMLSLCGKLAGGKRLHADLMNGPPEFLKAVLGGWLEGDGFNLPFGKAVLGTTVSRKMARQMAVIAIGLGLRCRLATQAGKPSGNVKTRQRRYDLHTSRMLTVEPQRPSEAWRVEYVDGGIWRKVMEISSEPFTGAVYNLEVAVDNSYIAGGLAVHNCVVSNTFRGCVRNFMAEIALRGDPEEFFGRDEFGPKNIAFFAPASYGWMRKRGGLTGRGDGGFCEPMIETLMKDGVVMCSTPKLLSLLGNGYPANHFPEPIGNPGLYRAIGDGRYLAELLPYTTCRMMNSERVTSADKFLEVSRKFNAIIQCSGIAIKKAGTHKDGFDFHVQNQSDSWAHNMSFHGFRVASDGKIFGRLSNESWGNDVIYNVPIEEIDRWHTRNLTESQSLGDFDQAKSVPVISPVIP